MHRSESNLLLCYVAHHDEAYAWGERRRLERHPTTGAAQLVEVRETVIEIPVYVEAAPIEVPAPPKLLLFANTSEEDLLGYGIPADWLADVRAATEDTILDLADHLPDEAAEALLSLATGGTPPAPVHAAADTDPFAHPDAQRRFRVMTDVAELERALESPWEKWVVFLHPAQRGIVERRYNGPARVAGSAGTGKTVVALHRAVDLARTYGQANVLLTTFSDTLARALGRKLDLLIGNEPAIRTRITVEAIDRVGARVYETMLGPGQIAEGRDPPRAAARGVGRGGDTPIQRSLLGDRVARRGGRLAVDGLGVVSRRGAAGAQDAPRGEAACAPLVDLRAGAHQAGRTRDDDRAERVRGRD